MAGCSNNSNGERYTRSKPISNEIRERIIELMKNGWLNKRIALMTGVSPASVSNIIQQYNRTGSYHHIPHRKGTKHTGQNIKDYVRFLKETEPYYTNHQIRDRLVRDQICSLEELPSQSTISRILRKSTHVDPTIVLNNEDSNDYDGLIDFSTDHDRIGWDGAFGSEQVSQNDLGHMLHHL